MSVQQQNQLQIKSMTKSGTASGQRHFWLIYNIRVLLSLRKKNKLRNQNLDLIYNGSIAIDYFFKRKKYFNQIFE